MKDPKKVYEY